jgi:hypothetical protein
MPLQKLTLKPGVNRENTRYTNEGGWYESDKVRFRQGTPEKIGGWQRISANTFVGTCRSLWNWVTLTGQNLLGIGTSVKFYIENGGAYYDVTPIRTENTLTSPFTTNTATNSGGYTTVTVTAPPGFANGDYVTFYGGTAVGGVTVLGEYQLTYLTSSTYSISVLGTASSSTTGGGTVYAVYQVTSGSATYTPSDGWGAGTWGTPPAVALPSTVGTWGYGVTVTLSATGTRIWNQTNWGQDLVYGPRGFPLYYWDATVGYSNTTITISIASPCVVICSLGLADLTPITLATTGALPPELIPGITYYVRYISSGSFNLATSATANAILSGVTITGTAGQFSCTASSITLVVGQSITISSINYDVALAGSRAVGAAGAIATSASTQSSGVAFGATGTIRVSASGINKGNVASGATGTIGVSSSTGGPISGYTNPTTYYIVATNGSTTFTLSTTAGGSGVPTMVGTPTGLTFTLSTIINTTGTQSGTQSVSPRGILLSSLAGSDGSCPLYQNTFTVSDASRFLLVFGTNDYGSTTLDPMLIRWSDQESLTTWFPAVTNQAGSLRLSHGSKIVTTLQSRQEILVWTDSTMYSLQYLGPPVVWGVQLLADNVSIIGPNATVMASGVSYWMGVDKFYKYDGRVQTLRCDLLRHVFNNINLQQSDQVFGSTNEGFNEVWWFYCSASSSAIDSYVVYNYTEDLWQYGSMARTAWLDSGLRNYPLAATYSYNIVEHENGVDDNTSGTPVAIEASITSSQYDIGDGHNFAFVYRMIPDLTFRGSTSGTTPAITMYLQGLNNSGSGITQSGSAGVTYNGAVPAVINVDEFTGQVYIRIRGRQMQMKITSNTLGTQWQLGAPRIDMRPDGRR